MPAKGLRICPWTKKLEEQYRFVSNIPFSYSGTESESNNVMMQVQELSNVHNSDRTFIATRSNLAYKIV